MIYCKGMNPGKILTVTYTVAATKDMADRFAVKFGQEMAERLEFRTIKDVYKRQEHGNSRNLCTGRPCDHYGTGT